MGIEPPILKKESHGINTKCHIWTTLVFWRWKHLGLRSFVFVCLFFFSPTALNQAAYQRQGREAIHAPAKFGVGRSGVCPWWRQEWPWRQRLISVSPFSAARPPKKGITVTKLVNLLENGAAKGKSRCKFAKVKEKLLKIDAPPSPSCQHCKLQPTWIVSEGLPVRPKGITQMSFSLSWLCNQPMPKYIYISFIYPTVEDDPARHVHLYTFHPHKKQDSWDHAGVDPPTQRLTAVCRWGTANRLVQRQQQRRRWGSREEKSSGWLVFRPGLRGCPTPGLPPSYQQTQWHL